MKRWQKWGLVASGFFVLLEAFLRALRLIWWCQETIWYQAVMSVNGPASELSRVLLQHFRVPRMYDTPFGWREVIIFDLTWFGLGAIWWFCLGAAASVARTWLARRLVRNS